MRSCWKAKAASASSSNPSPAGAATKREIRSTSMAGIVAALPPPRRRRGRHRPAQVEGDLEVAAWTLQGVREALAGDELEAPDVLDGLRPPGAEEQLARVLVGRESLLGGAAGSVAVAAVEG